jgi:hypothetical protein
MPPLLNHINNLIKSSCKTYFLFLPKNLITGGIRTRVFTQADEITTETPSQGKKMKILEQAVLSRLVVSSLFEELMSCEIGDCVVTLKMRKEKSRKFALAE